MVRTLFAFERLRLVLERRHPLVPTREAVARNRLARVGRSAETTRRLQLDLRCLTSPDILSWCPGCACQTPRADSLVNWAGHLDTAWAPEKLLGAPGSREYLFGLPAALLSQSGFSSLAELVNSQQQLSILKMGLVDKPTPSMLVVNGLKDTLVPAADTMLLLQHGMPKAAWIRSVTKARPSSAANTPAPSDFRQGATPIARWCATSLDRMPRRFGAA